MLLKHYQSLRFRLWAIIILAVLPLFLMAFLDYKNRREDTIIHLNQDIAQIVVSAQLEESAALKSVELLLKIMSRADNISALDPSDCSQLSARLLLSLETIFNLGAVLPDGTVFCSALPIQNEVNVSDRTWFQQAIQSNGLAQGEYVMGRVSKNQGIVLGYPVRYKKGEKNKEGNVENKEGEIKFVLFAFIKTAWFDNLVEKFKLPEGWNAILFTDMGKILSYHPIPAPQINEATLPATVAPFLDAAKKGAQTTELQGLDGKRRMYSVSALGLTKTPLFIAIGAPVERSLSHIDQHFWIHIVLLVVITLASALVARYYVYNLIEAWTHKLTNAIQALALGKLGTRIEQFSSIQEFEVVEKGINHMAVELGQRDTELRHLSTAIKQSPESIVITNVEGEIEYVNDAFVRITGYTRKDALGQNPRILNAKQTPQSTYDGMWATLLSGKSWQGEFINTRKDGSIYTEMASIAPIIDREGNITHYVAVKEDITQRRKSEELLHRLAYYDPLTDLANRALLQKCLLQTSVQSTQTHCHGMLLVMDIDRFKQINDTQGHDAGDLMLQEVARRIQRSVREQDTAARLGGNTFALVVGMMSDDASTAVAEARLMAQEIHHALAAPYNLGDSSSRPYTTTSSMGITLFNGDEPATASFLKQAEVALYKAKEEGGNAILFFNASMQANVDARAAIEMGLHEAIKEQAFRLFYQVQVDQTGKPVGAEALIRWFDRNGKMISPADFIPVAEETGLIVPIGQWVLETACQQLHTWQQRPETQPLTIAVNVSAKQFHQPDFFDLVRLTIERSGIDPSRLKLELTESVILGDLEATIAKMQQLRSLGLRFSLDDFGTGYSSLSYLKRLPFDQLKIDQSFVRDMLADHSSAAIVRAILVMSEALGLQVVAEGVETLEESEFLRANGCQFCQGYLNGRPVPIQAWEAAHLPDLPRIDLVTPA